MTNNENKNRGDLFDKIAAEYDRKIDRAREIAETAARNVACTVWADSERMPPDRLRALGGQVLDWDPWFKRGRKAAANWAINIAVSKLSRDMATAFDGLRRYGSINCLSKRSRGAYDRAHTVLLALMWWEPSRLTYIRALGAFYNVIDLLENRQKRLWEQVDAQGRLTEKTAVDTLEKV